jgi:hypothetical protein
MPVALSEGGIPSASSSSSMFGVYNSSESGIQQQQQQNAHAEQLGGCEGPTYAQQQPQQQGCRVDGGGKHSSLAGTAAAAAGQAGMARSRFSEGDLPRLHRQQQQQQQAAGKPASQQLHTRPQSHKQQQQEKQKQQRMQLAYGTAADSGSKAKRHDGLLAWFMRHEKHDKTAHKQHNATASDDGSQTASMGRREVSSAHSSREAVKPDWSSDSSADAVQPWTASDMEPDHQQQQQHEVSGVDCGFVMQPVATPTYVRGSSHGGSSRDSAELQRPGSSSCSGSDSDSSDSSAGNAAIMPRVPFAPQPPSSSRPAAVAAAPRRLQVAGQALQAAC